MARRHLPTLLDQKDAPEKMVETRELWKLLQRDEYDVIISNLAFNELRKCTAKKRAALVKYTQLIKGEC